MTKLISISFLLAAVFTLAANAPAVESSGERIVTTRHQIEEITLFILATLARLKRMLHQLADRPRIGRAANPCVKTAI